MATNDATSMSRRATIAALAGTPIFVGTMAASISGAEAETAAEPSEPDEDLYRLGNDKGKEITLLYMARAWIDRWEAAGGHFGIFYNRDGTFSELLLGISEPGFWTPTDEGNDRLPPHLWLTEPEHQSGAKRALESLLDLVPDLRKTVREIAGMRYFAATAVPASEREG